MPSFWFLTEQELDAIVAYLNRLGNKQTASTDLMVSPEYFDKKQPYPTDIKTWSEGRNIYLDRCYTCHGCAGSGDGPYAYMNNARPADLRQPRYHNLEPSFFMWRSARESRHSHAAVGATLSEKDRWKVIVFIQGAFMDMVPHFTDEGEMPARYANATRALPSDHGHARSRQVDLHHELRVLPRLWWHWRWS